MNEQDVQIIERAWAEDAAGETIPGEVVKAILAGTLARVAQAPRIHIRRTGRASRCLKRISVAPGRTHCAGQKDAEMAAIRCSRDGYP